MLKLVLLGLSLLAMTMAQRGDTPLDDYIMKPENVTEYTFLYTLDDPDLEVVVHVLNFTSLYWVDETCSDRPLWWHYLQIVIPYPSRARYHDDAIFWVSEYTNEQDPPTPDNDYFQPLAKQVAHETGAVCILLNQIPNGPFVFPDDPMQEEKVSDSAIAFTWKKYLTIDDPRDEEVLLLFPMAKSTVLALDVVTEYTLNVTNGQTDIMGFLMSGASKRGWATYLAAATDPKDRIWAIAPMVLTMINMVENLNKHVQAYDGGWSWAMNPYYRENITMLLNHPDTAYMFSLQDPYSFFDRLTMPKYLICSSGDEFFLPDDSHMFWDVMPEPKHFLMLENTNHPMVGHHDRLVNAIATFFIALKEGFVMPQITWERSTDSEGGQIDLATDTDPLTMTAWTADTTNDTDIRRDFRKLIGPDPERPVLNNCTWYETQVTDYGNNTFRLEMDNPEDAYFRSFYMSGQWDGPEGRVFDFTSEVVIIEDIFPSEPCSTLDCYGWLV